MVTIIADSGGTKTDFCIINSSGEKEFLTRDSYRHDSFDTNKLEKERVFWNTKINTIDARLVFFGAGCFSEKGKEDQNAILIELGFQNFKIHSDLHGAGLSAYGEKSGFVSIMGTGSVFFCWTGSDVEQVIGGKGHLEGDEGSGYYFAKLCLIKHQNKELNSEQDSIVTKVLNAMPIDKDLLCDKQRMSAISVQLIQSGVDFNDIHIENIRLFFEPILETRILNNLTIIGGYGWQQKVNIRRFLKKLNGISIQFVEKPLRSLIEYTIFLID